MTDENTSENPFDQWRRAAQALKAAGIGSITYRYDGHSGLTGFLSIELWDADHLLLPDDAVSEDVMIDFAEFLTLLLSTRPPGGIGVQDRTVCLSGSPPADGCGTCITRGPFK
jgi:hypothetical protein